MILALLAATAMQTTPASPSAAAPGNAVSPVVISREAAEAKRAAQDPNTLVCKTEPVLGSRMPVKKCATVGQMAMRKFEDRQSLEKIQARDQNHP